MTDKTQIDWAKETMYSMAKDIAASQQSKSEIVGLGSRKTRGLDKRTLDPFYINQQLIC